MPSVEVFLAAGVTIAVAAGIVVAGGSWRPAEIVVLLAGTALGFAFGWPASGHAALGAAAAYLILETVARRLGGSHLAANVLLTAGVLGSVLAAGLASPSAAVERRPGEIADDEPDARVGELAEHEATGRRRLAPGTLDTEIELARLTGQPLSLLAIRLDEPEVLTAAGHRPEDILDLIDVAIDNSVRGGRAVGWASATRVEAVLSETTAETARSIAEQIRLRIDSARPQPSPDLPARVTVSIGVATYPMDGTDEVALAAAAERALGRAAELGGNRTMLHSRPLGAPPGWALSASRAATPPPPGP